jgi:hypothetical protein
MPYDYSKLNGKIVEMYGTQAKFAKAMNLSTRSLSLKVNGKIGWKQGEIDKACYILGVPKDEIPLYFFTLKVQQIELIAK